VYNDTTKAAPHVSHYDFSALLLIKMQIYRGGGASERASEQERERERARERERERYREVRRITSGGATTNTGI